MRLCESAICGQIDYVILNNNQLTLVNKKRIGRTASSKLSSSSLLICNRSSTQPSVLSTSISSSATSLSRIVASSSSSMLPASSISSIVTSSAISSFLASGKSNCFKILLTTKFSMCVKHLARFGAPGKSSRRDSSSSIIVSLFAALSHVTDKICIENAKSCYLVEYSGTCLIADAKVFKNFCKCSSEIDTRMRASNLDDIK